MEALLPEIPCNRPFEETYRDILPTTRAYAYERSEKKENHSYTGDHLVMTSLAASRFIA